MDINGKNFLITGGSSGIGKATAKAIVDEGGWVAITGRDEGKLRKVADELGGLAIPADVSDPEDVAATYKAFFEKADTLHGLINNAGIGIRRDVDELTPEDIRKVHDVNITGAAMMASHAAKYFKEQKHGNLVNIGSTAGTKGYPGGSIYVSSKFALRGMSYCWQQELRPYNVRVMIINPSEVTTAFGQEGRKERAEIPNKLRPEEIAHAILSNLKMDDRGFIPEYQVIATNPWD